MKYKGLVFTNHIIERIKQRGISHDYVYWVWRRPDKQESGKTNNSTKFFRRNKHEWFVVVGKKNEHGEWILLTCWSKPFYEQGHGRTRRSGEVGFWENLKRMVIGE